MGRLRALLDLLRDRPDPVLRQVDEKLAQMNRAVERIEQRSAPARAVHGAIAFMDKERAGNAD